MVFVIKVCVVCHHGVESQAFGVALRLVLIYLLFPRKSIFQMVSSDK